MTTIIPQSRHYTPTTLHLMDQPLHTQSSPRALPQGFSIYQPAPGAQVQFFPALGSQELDDLLHAYLPGPNSISDKRAAVTIDFFQQSQIDGQSFRFYQVDTVEMITHATSPSTTSSSPAHSSSSSQASFPATPSWDFSNISDVASMRSGKSSAKPRKSSKALSASSNRVELGSLPGMKIMTKDGLDVTNSASRGSKTKEQRDHAHMMRIMKACDSCRAKKVRCDPSHKRHSSTAAVPATPTRASTNRISKSASRSPATSQPSPMSLRTTSVLSGGLPLPAAPSTAMDASSSFMADLPSFEPSMSVADDFVFDDALWNELMADEQFNAPVPGNMAELGPAHTDLFSTQSSAASSSGSSSSPGMGPYYSDLSQSSTQASSPTDAAASHADASAHMSVSNDGTIAPSLLLSGMFDVSASDGADASQLVGPRMDRSAATQDILDATIVAPDDSATGGETARAMLRDLDPNHTGLDGPEGVERSVGHAAAPSNTRLQGTEVYANTTDDTSSPPSMVAQTQPACSSSSAKRTLEDPGKSVLDRVDVEALSAGTSSSAIAEEPGQVPLSTVALGGDNHVTPPEPMRERERQQQTAGDDTSTEIDRPRGTEDIIAALPPLSSAVYLATTLLWQFSLAVHSQAAKSQTVESVHSLSKGRSYAAKHVRGTAALGNHLARAQAVC